MPEYEYWLYRYSRTGPHKIEFVPVREITESAYREAGDAIHTIARAMEGSGSFAQIALSDLNGLIRQLEQWDATRIRNEYVVWMSHLRYRVVAVSAAVKMHQEAVYAALNRSRGPKSDESMAARALFASIYDASLAYRVVYHYRNAVVHGSRGLGRADARHSLVETDGVERTVFEMHYRLARAEVTSGVPHSGVARGGSSLLT